MQAHVQVEGTLTGVDNTAGLRGAMPDRQRAEAMQAHASLSGSSRGRARPYRGAKKLELARSARGRLDKPPAHQTGAW